MSEILLDADGLNSKFGFGDGDGLDDALEEMGVPWQSDRDYYLPNHHEILARVVERLVVPKLDLPDGAEVYRIGTCHNPIRLRDEVDDLPMVPVNLAAIRNIAAEVEVERGRGKP